MHVFQILTSAHCRKSCSLAFLESQSIRRPESDTPVKHQNTKIYHKAIQIKRSEVLHLLKSQSPWGASVDARAENGSSLPFPSMPSLLWDLWASGHHLLDQTWAGDAKWPWEPLGFSLRAGKGEVWEGPTRALFSPVLDSFVQKEPFQSTRRWTTTVRAPHHAGGKLLDPKKHSGGFLRAMASKVTWGWHVHKLSNALVQIPGLNIGAGRCQPSSVTWTPKGSSEGRHPSRCSLARAQQLLVQALLLGSASPAPSWQLVTLWQHLLTAPRQGRWSRSGLAWWLVPLGTPLSWHMAERPSGCLNPSTHSSTRLRHNQKPLIHVTLDTTVLLRSPYLKNCSETCYRNRKFWESLSDIWLLLLWVRGPKSDEELKLWRTNKIMHSKVFSVRFREIFPKAWICPTYSGNVLLGGGEVLAITRPSLPTFSAESLHFSQQKLILVT